MGPHPPGQALLLVLVLLIPTLLAVLAGIFRGSLADLSTLPLRWWPVAAASLLAQAALFSPLLEMQPWAITWGPWLYVASMAIVGFALVASARAIQVGRLSFCVAAIGVALNCVVVASNGGHMPRSEQAAALLSRSRAAQPDEAQSRLVNVQPIDEDTRFAWLGDVIPEPDWLPLANVISIGDLFLAVGLGWGTARVTVPSAGWPLRWRGFRSRADLSSAGSG